MATKISELEKLTQKHYDKLVNIANTFESDDPYKQGFVNHLLYDYLFDVNAISREITVQEAAERLGGLRAYRQALAFDLEHLDLIVKIVKQVFDNSRVEITSYYDDPTETIDISQDYLNDFYDIYNEYLKQLLTSQNIIDIVKILNKKEVLHYDGY